MNGISIYGRFFTLFGLNFCRRTTIPIDPIKISSEPGSIFSTFTIVFCSPVTIPPVPRPTSIYPKIIAPATRATKPTALPPILLVATPVDFAAVLDVLFALCCDVVIVVADVDIVIVDDVVIAAIVVELENNDDVDEERNEMVVVDKPEEVAFSEAAGLVGLTAFSTFFAAFL